MHRPSVRPGRLSRLGWLAALLLGGGGCPPVGQHRPPPPAPSKFTSYEAATEIAPPRAGVDPRLGPPPFALTVVDGDGVDSDAIAVRAQLLALLRRSGAFVLPTPGAAPSSCTRVRIDGSPRSGSTVAQLRLPLPDVRPAALSSAARGARGAALELAAAIYRAHLGRAGPFFDRIAFVAGTAQNRRAKQVFVVGFDGGGIERLSNDGSLNILPAWSPMGDLAFTSYARGAPQLFIMPAGTRRARPLRASGGLNIGAAFTPDGKALAVAISRDDNTDIYLVDPRDGAIGRRLTTDRGIDVSPSWSPDGSQLAFVSDRSGSPQIYVIALAGGPVRRLTHAGGYNEEPAWCPRRDSATIAYTHRHPNERYAIHLLDARSGLEAPLTEPRGDNRSPAWSPDCQLLAYSAGKQGLWLITHDGKQRFRLFGGPAASPAWYRGRRE